MRNDRANPLLTIIFQLGYCEDGLIQYLSPLQLHHIPLLLPTNQRREFRTLVARTDLPFGIRPVILMDSATIDRFSKRLQSLSRHRLDRQRVPRIGHLEIVLDATTLEAINLQLLAGRLTPPPRVDRLLLTTSGSLSKTNQSERLDRILVLLIQHLTSDRYRYAPMQIIWRHRDAQPLNVYSGFVHDVILSAHGSESFHLPQQLIVHPIRQPWPSSRQYPSDNFRLRRIIVEGRDRRLALTLIPALQAMQAARIGSWLFQDDGTIDPTWCTWGGWNVEEGLLPTVLLEECSTTEEEVCDSHQFMSPPEWVPGADVTPCNAHQILTLAGSENLNSYPYETRAKWKIFGSLAREGLEGWKHE